MSVEPKDGRLSVVTRERLAVTLAAPFLLLLASSLASWPWRSLGLPGVVGTMTPPGILLLALAVAAAMLALRRGLPLGMITWLPAGQGAIVLLTTGFVAETPTAAAGAAVIVAYVLIYLIALGVALAVAGHGAALGAAYISLFLLTQTVRFPVFGLDSSVDVTAAGLLTFTAAVRATVETGLVIVLTRRLVEAPEGQAGGSAALLVALAVLHGVFASWEDPVLRGEFSLLEVTEQAARWFVFVGIQLGMALALIRLRRSWGREPRWAEPLAEAAAAEPTAAGLPPRSETPLRRGRRPTPRRRRRR